MQIEKRRRGMYTERNRDAQERNRDESSGFADKGVRPSNPLIFAMVFPA